LCITIPVTNSDYYQSGSSVIGGPVTRADPTLAIDAFAVFCLAATLGMKQLSPVHRRPWNSVISGLWHCAATSKSIFRATVQRS